VSKEVAYIPGPQLVDSAVAESVREAGGMSDKQKRDAAVDAFAAEIKARLDERAAKGYTGWDGEYPAQHLAAEIRQDTKTTDHGQSKAVDIGARAMMLWFRSAGGQAG